MFFYAFKIFCWMLKARTNASYHIGYPDSSNNDIIKYSYYLGIDSSLPMHDINHHHPRHALMTQLSNHDAVPNAYFTTISIKRACETIVKCLEKDRGDIFKSFLQSETQVFTISITRSSLRNRALHEFLSLTFLLR